MQRFDEDNKPWDCVVIGAGICGLLAAQRVQDAGYRVLVLDKGRQVGGRMANRRMFRKFAQYTEARFAAVPAV